jgi:hypothetical protein
MSDDPGPRINESVVLLSPEDRADVVRRRATCPFVGSAVAAEALPVHCEAGRPLARIEDLARLGDAGGGDLGELLAFFARGNHGFMAGASGRLDRPVPPGLFSLDLPGSQGSHPGHSGMLQGDPGEVASGRFDEEAFGRFIAPARDGLLKRSDVGRFIAENLRRDPASKVFGPKVAALLAVDLARFAGQVGPAALEAISNAAGGAESAEARRLDAHLTKLLAEDNLVGSAGEYGLLFAFFEYQPGARTIDGEPALAITDLTRLFRDKAFPPGWDTWPKRRIGWVVNTTALMISAGRAYLFEAPPAAG